MPSESAAKRKRGRPRTARPTSESTPVRALDRGLVLLQALSREGRAKLSDLAEATALPVSTAHRLLTTLQQHGFAEFSEAAQEWSVGIGAYRTGVAYLMGTNLVDGSRRILRQLMEDTGETANLATLEDGRIVFVSQVETRNPVRAFFRAGSRSPMHASGIGKAILAALPEREIAAILQMHGLDAFTPCTLTTPETLMADLAQVRARGWALDDEEQHVGMRCVAAVIRNGFGEAIAGVSVSGPAARFDPDAVSRYAAAVTRAAGEISEVIGGTR